MELLGPELTEAARRIVRQPAVKEPVRAEESIRAVSQEWAFCGSFPRWSTTRAGLYWADRLAPAVHFFDGINDHKIASVESPIIGMELHKDSVLIARNEGWLLIDADGTAGPLTPWQYGSPHCLCVDGEGTLWATLPKDGAWQLGRFSEGEGFKSHWQFSEPIDAIAWNKGNTALYALAPDSGTIYLLTRESPAIRRFASLPKGSGRLSGLALDFDCGVWTALKEGWSVVQFSADGNLERLMGVSMPSPTDLEFGGPDNNTLYLTSDRHSPSREALISAPLSGYLLEAHVDQAGIARSPSRFPAS